MSGLKQLFNRSRGRASARRGNRISNRRGKLPRPKTWQLALLLIPLAFLSATLLRLDHLKMVELKQAVVTADEEGNVDKITTTLNDLKTYVETHTVINITEKNGDYDISFGSGELYLANEYERTATALKIQAQENAGTYANPNGNIYEKAMSVCQPLAHQNGWSWDTPEHIQCYQNELAKYPVEDAISDIEAPLPSTALYRYDFASPLWTLSPSGLVNLLILLLVIVLIFRFFAWLILKLALKFVK